MLRGQTHDIGPGENEMYSVGDGELREPKQIQIAKRSHKGRADSLKVTLCNMLWPLHTN